MQDLDSAKERAEETPNLRDKHVATKTAMRLLIEPLSMLWRVYCGEGRLFRQ